MKHAYIPRTTTYNLNPGEELNDLRMSDEVRPLYEHVKKFIRETVDPMSVEFAKLGEKKTDRWSFTPEQLGVPAEGQGQGQGRRPVELLPARRRDRPGPEEPRLRLYRGRAREEPDGLGDHELLGADTGNMEVLERVGTKAQKEKWLKPLLAGEIRSAYAMTEPNVASSDAKNISTTAKLVGDEWVINGEKYYISGAGDPRCKIMIVMVKTNPDAPPSKQQSQILVPIDTPASRSRADARVRPRPRAARPHASALQQLPGAEGEHAARRRPRL
jgi:acyl-CoA dehydrogenase